MAANEPDRSADRWILTVLFVVAVAIRLCAIALGDNDDGDSVVRLLVTRSIIAHPSLVPVGDWISGHYYLLAIPSLLGLKQQVWFMIWTALLSALAAPLIFLLVREFFGKAAGIASALFLAIAAIHVRVSILTVAEGPFVTLVLLGLLMFCRYLRSGRRPHLVIGALAFSAACSLRHEAWLFPIVTFAGGLLPNLFWGERTIRQRDLSRTFVFTLAALAFPIVWSGMCFVVYGDPFYVQNFTMNHVRDGGLGVIRSAGVGLLAAFWPVLMVASLGPVAAAISICGLVTSLRRKDALRLCMLALAAIVMMVIPPRSHVQARYGITPAVVLLMFVGPGLEWLAGYLRASDGGRWLRWFAYAATIAWLAVVPAIASMDNLGALSQKMRSVTPLPRFDPRIHEVNEWLQANSGRDGAIVLAGDVGAGGPWLSLADRWYDIQLWDRYIDRDKDRRQLHFTKALEDLVSIVDQNGRGYVVTPASSAVQVKATLDSRLNPHRQHTSPPVFINNQFAVIGWKTLG